MDCWPELLVSKRKPLSLSKMAKRLRRFVADNQRPEVPLGEGDAAEAAAHELVCRVPDETLFQLQQIFEALESRTADGGSKQKKDRRKSAANAVGATSDYGDLSLLPRPAAAAEAAASLLSATTPKKTPSKKRARGPDAPLTEHVNRRAGQANGGETERKHSKKKKERRKSAST